MRVCVMVQLYIMCPHVSFYLEMQAVQTASQATWCCQGTDHPESVWYTGPESQGSICHDNQLVVVGNSLCNMACTNSRGTEEEEEDILVELVSLASAHPNKTD